MASKYWMKLYYEMLDDPKIGRLSDRLFRRTIQCYLLAGDYKKGDTLPPIDKVAWRLRCDPEELENELVELGKHDILFRENDQWHVTNFMVRQMAMSGSERARRWYERNKDIDWAKDLYKGLPAKPGVYRLTCKKTGKHYIGATNNIHTRIKQHLYSISKDQHPMSDDALTYGVKSLEIEILERLDDESKLSERETYWLHKYPQDDLYNQKLSPIPHQNWNKEDA